MSQPERCNDWRIRDLNTCALRFCVCVRHNFEWGQNSCHLTGPNFERRGVVTSGTCLSTLEVKSRILHYSNISKRESNTRYVSLSTRSIVSFTCAKWTVDRLKCLQNMHIWTVIPWVFDHLCALKINARGLSTHGLYRSVVRTYNRCAWTLCSLDSVPYMCAQ